MAGLQRLCKLYGRMEVNSGGKKVMWCWDYAKDEPRIEKEMTKEEKTASEKARFELLKSAMK